jgi:hypothetical protein
MTGRALLWLKVSDLWRAAPSPVPISRHFAFAHRARLLRDPGFARKPSSDQQMAQLVNHDVPDQLAGQEQKTGNDSYRLAHSSVGAKKRIRAREQERRARQPADPG